MKIQESLATLARTCSGVCVPSVVLLILAQPALAGSIFDIALDTSALSGSGAQLAFSFISGDPASNSVTISEFATDGVLGASMGTSGVSGTLPGAVTIDDAEFFNDFLQTLTLGGAIQFALTVTREFQGPTPDQLALFLLDPTLGVPLFDTSDPTGANALFAVDITGTEFGSYQVFHQTLRAEPRVRTAVPLPSSLLLLGTGALALVAFRRNSRRV
jgi:hypothetical protein